MKLGKEINPPFNSISRVYTEAALASVSPRGLTAGSSVRVTPWIPRLNRGTTQTASAAENLSDSDAGLIFPRIDIDHEDDFLSLGALASANIRPVLVKNQLALHSTRWTHSFFNELIMQHVAMAKRLVELGFSHLVIAADGDSAWQKILSPRFSSHDINQRKAPFLDLYCAMREITGHVVVLLTVEELAPEGMDATDGILIANDLEHLGLKEIIATSGTRDFLPLYTRRETCQKPSVPDQFFSNSPHLASAIWLQGRTNLSIWCSAFFEDKERTITLARRLGIAGLIEKPSINIY
ncbi:MAG TPA: hypothetical protein VEL47_03565 [Myxococcota bacterium]|nr:hypothetical protein [Myxococcota bacterium]